ncbi:LysE family translocator [Salinarimonas sp.]|uniref:LysE family translocator n=1 Tax=Salinarimonas sp. TaxID=2766526 RepID=UPI003919C765
MQPEFFVFLVLVISLIVVPGPDMLYVVGRSLVHGRSGALYASAGIAAGYLLFTGLVAVGVGVLFALDETVFRVVQICGLAYLTYLAWRLFRADGMMPEGAPNSTASKSGDFLFGVATSALNPKGILFYFSILPQFIVPAGGALWRQALILGSTTSFLCLVIYCAAGLSAHAGSKRWVTSASRRRTVARLAGVMLILAIAMIAGARFH